MAQKNLLLRILYFCGIVIVPQLGTAAFLLIAGRGPLGMVAGMAICAVIIVALFQIYQKQLQENNPRHFGFKSIANNFKWVILGVIGMYVLAILFSLFVPTNPENQQTIEELYVGNPALIGIFVVLIAPMVEELTFRGIYLNLFFKEDTPNSNLLAIVCSAVLFGLMHEPRLSMSLVIYVTLGLGLASVYMKTRDIRCSILTHMIYNGLSYFAMFLTLS